MELGLLALLVFGLLFWSSWVMAWGYASASVDPSVAMEDDWMMRRGAREEVFCLSWLRCGSAVCVIKHTALFLL